MDKELRASLETIVKKLSNKQQVEIKEHIDPSLIGGFVLHVGDRQIDASVKGKLKVLSLKFNENYFAK